MGYLLAVFGGPGILLAALTTYAWWGWGRKQREDTHVSPEWVTAYAYAEGKKGDVL